MITLVDVAIKFKEGTEQNLIIQLDEYLGKKAAWCNRVTAAWTRIDLREVIRVINGYVVGVETITVIYNTTVPEATADESSGDVCTVQ